MCFACYLTNIHFSSSEACLQQVWSDTLKSSDTKIEKTNFFQKNQTVEVLLKMFVCFPTKNSSTNKTIFRFLWRMSINMQGNSIILLLNSRLRCSNCPFYFNFRLISNNPKIEVYLSRRSKSKRGFPIPKNIPESFCACLLK
jgi:hypothetical protein